MSPTTNSRSQQDNFALIDNVNGLGLTLLLFAVLGSTWALTASGEKDHGWMLAGITVTAVALLIGIVGTAVERRHSRTRTDRKS